MKKLVSILGLTLLAMGLFSCAKPDADYVHDDATISAIYVLSTMKDATGKTLSVSFPGVINQEDGSIAFTITKDKRKQIDLTAVKLRANVGYDAYIKVTKEAGKDVDRTLYGIHDLSEGLELTVTARMTGRTKDYHITARYEK